MAPDPFRGRMNDNVSTVLNRPDEISCDPNWIRCVGNPQNELTANSEGVVHDQGYSVIMSNLVLLNRVHQLTAHDCTRRNRPLPEQVYQKLDI